MLSAPADSTAGTLSFSNQNVPVMGFPSTSTTCGTCPLCLAGSRLVH